MLFAGGAAHQQRENIRSGQRRVGAIRGLQAIEGPGDVERQVVLLDARLRLEVDEHLGAEGIGQGDVASRYPVRIPQSLRLAALDVHIPESNRVCQGSLNLHVNRGDQGQVLGWRFKPDLRVGSHLDVQPYLRGDRRGDARSLLERPAPHFPDPRHPVEILARENVADAQLAGELPPIRRPCQVQVPGQRRRDLSGKLDARLIETDLKVKLGSSE